MYDRLALLRFRQRLCLARALSTWTMLMKKARAMALGLCFRVLQGGSELAAGKLLRACGQLLGHQEHVGKIFGTES